MPQLDFQWKYAAPLFSGLRLQPDYGTKEGWERLYEQAWGHLAKAGLTKVKSPLDLTRIKLRIAALGWKVKDIYWTLGDHDGLLILEAPDDETATAAVLHLGAMGNVHTTTVRAFTAAEMDKIVAKVHGG